MHLNENFFIFYGHLTLLPRNNPIQFHKKHFEVWPNFSLSGTNSCFGQCGEYSFEKELQGICQCDGYCDFAVNANCKQPQRPRYILITLLISLHSLIAIFTINSETNDDYALNRLSKNEKDNHRIEIVTVCSPILSAEVYTVSTQYTQYTQELG